MTLGAMTWTCLVLSAAAAPPSDVQPMNNKAFQIPIRFDPQKRSEIRELQLWVSHDKGQTWNEAAQARPDQDHFDYAVTEDGPYWFTMVIIDQKGRPDPPNIYTAAVGQRILVDTVRPDIKLTADRQGNDVMVSWEITEQNPRPDTLKLEYAESGEGPWTPVPIKQGPTGHAEIQDPSPVVVRMQMRDVADNVGMAMKPVPASNGGPALAAAPPAPFDNPPVPPLPAPVGSAAPPLPKSIDHTPDASHLPPPDLPPGPLPAPPAPPPAAAPLAVSSQKTMGAQPAAFSPTPPGVGPLSPPGVGPLAGSDSGPAHTEMPPLQIVNKRDVKLEFEVGKFGPSGLGGVDVYVTTDDGGSWQQTAVDPHGVMLPAADARIGGSVRASVTVQLMNEGVTYGFFVVAKSKAGLGRPAPKPGDLPQIRVELDATPPKATLVKVEANPSRPDTLTLIWLAEDKHLTGTPVTLEWSAQAGPDAQWNPIGPPELENTGRYEWQPGPEVPPNVYLRMTVRDTAGNRTVAQSKQPVLIDLSVPEVTNINLGGASGVGFVPAPH